MKKTILFISLLVLSIMFYSCKTESISNVGPTVQASKSTNKPVDKKVKQADVDPKLLEEFATVMQGRYSSAKQAAKDKTFFNITLQMTPIWKTKGNYLYVEQAITKSQNKPYRIKIYKLSQRSNEEFICEVFSIKNEKNWIGKYKMPKAFDKLTESDIELKKGCEIVYKRLSENVFNGKSGKKSCPSELRGASYATSKTDIFKDKIIAWDQGFDKKGKQVWGSIQGGYILDKVLAIASNPSLIKPIVKKKKTILKKNK
jgi:CpeT protein